MALPFFMGVGIKEASDVCTEEVKLVTLNSMKWRLRTNPLIWLVGRAGLEPTTKGLSVPQL